MEIVSALAHDIGHELATVSCLVTAVRRDPGLSPHNRRRLDLVEREVGRLQELVGLRFDDDVAPEVSVADLVDEIVAPLALGSTTAVTAAPASDVRLRVDSRALWRLLANLVGNAVRAAGPGGTVRVLVTGGPPVIEVHDDGPGPGAGPPGHAGLGLATSRGLAARCGADLALVPSPVGGTVARLRFAPTTAAAPAPGSVAP